MALYEVYVDGASRGQGSIDKDDHEGKGHGACGVLIFKNRKLIGQYARALGRVTNNEAEYEAVICGLLMCWAADLEDPIIYSDSALVVKQVTGEVPCKNDDLIPLLYSIKEIEQDFRFRIVHVNRKVVGEADLLANKFLDSILEPKNSENGRKSAVSNPRRAPKGKR